ncbi:Uncharacterised protein [Mycobacteroides abscessus subsp. abscessus]|nr:Uncharacterised protein [Mycobacteroides abscessus subsp. abscessus]
MGFVGFVGFVGFGAHFPGVHSAFMSGIVAPFWGQITIC